MASPSPHKFWEQPINCALQTRTRLIVGTSIALFGTAGDAYKIRRIGKGMFVHSNTFVQISDGDTGTPAAVFDLEITDGTTTKAIISGATTAQAGGGVRPSKAAATEPGCSWVTPSGAYWVQLRCTTAAATAAAVDITVTLVVSGETEGSGTLVE